MWLECVKQDDNNTFMMNIQENAIVGANNQCNVLKNSKKLCNGLESSIFATRQIDWHFAIVIDEYEYYIKSSSSWSREREVEMEKDCCEYCATIKSQWSVFRAEGRQEATPCSVCKIERHLDSCWKKNI